MLEGLRGSTFRGKGLTALTWGKWEPAEDPPHRLVACSFPVLGWGLRPLPLSHTTNQGVVLWHEGFSDHNIKASDAQSAAVQDTEQARASPHAEPFLST